MGLWCKYGLIQVSDVKVVVDTWKCGFWLLVAFFVGGEEMLIYFLEWDCLFRCLFLIVLVYKWSFVIMVQFLSGNEIKTGVVYEVYVNGKFLSMIYALRGTKV